MSELEPERREGAGGDRLPRPLPTRSLPERAAAWMSWVGPGRLLGTVVVAAAVVVGAYWLTRAPTPPTEQQLPFTAGTAPTTTVPDVPDPAAAGTERAPDDPSALEEAPVAVVVHVAGAVTGPGVYRLDGDARVHTAIDAAGGATADADLDGLNLAATVADGQRIYVPVVGEVDPATVPSGPPAAGPATDGTSPVDGPVDLNRAGPAELETLPGIGPATAAAIVDDRTRNGPFASIDDLDRVSGIGPAKLAAIRDLVTV